MTAPAIVVDHVVKSFGSVRAVDDVSFAVSPGEVFGLIGPNGAGKTTTIKLLLDVLRPDSGTAHVSGQIGYIPGDIPPLGRLTGADLLGFFADLGKARKHSSRTERAARQRASELAEFLDFDPSRRVRELSKGNRQKLAVIQAFMHDPDAFILDEPTSGLDPLVQQQFLTLVHQAADRGAAVLLSSHVLSEVEHAAHQFALLKAGKLTEPQSLSSLRRTLGKSVVIDGATDGLEQQLRALPGVSRLIRQRQQLHCAFHGDVADLCQIIAQHRPTDVAITPVDLEHYVHAQYAPDQPEATAEHPESGEQL